jgi:hypothetical protein
MGGISSTIDKNEPIVTKEGKVRLYSKDDYKGNVYEIDYGNYTSNMFIYKISPDNVFSLTVPPHTSVRMYCCDIYDYGGRGYMDITNITNERVDVPSLPQNIRGYVRSLSIIKYYNDTMNGASLALTNPGTGNTDPTVDTPSIYSVSNIGTAPNISSTYTTSNVLGDPGISNVNSTINQNTQSVSTFEYFNEYRDTGIMIEQIIIIMLCLFSFLLILDFI